MHHFLFLFPSFGSSLRAAAKTRSPARYFVWSSLLRHQASAIAIAFQWPVIDQWDLGFEKRVRNSRKWARNLTCTSEHLFLGCVDAWLNAPQLKFCNYMYESLPACICWWHYSCLDSQYEYSHNCVHFYYFVLLLNSYLLSILASYPMHICKR